MTSKDKHQKHVFLPKPQYGEFARNELAIMGSSCGTIQELVDRMVGAISPFYNLAYVDKEHGDTGAREQIDSEAYKSSIVEKVYFTRLDTPRPLSAFDKRRLLNSEDLVFINGNHFLAQRQILIIDPAKNLEKKLDRLTDVKLILFRDSTLSLPEYLKERLKDWQAIPAFDLSDTGKITGWIKAWIDQKTAPLKGLVLAGGESRRMQKDKSTLVYHGRSQREHVLSLLQQRCSSAYLSCNHSQAETLKGKVDVIEDVFLKLGPIGGILSAFRHDPNAAWLTVACDLPYLSEPTLQYLIEHRNPSKVATAFLDSQGVYPEPLVTIWEPRAYPVLLEYLSQGYSCPRKVLINSEVEILKAPHRKDFHNVNDPEEYDRVLKELGAVSGGKIK